MLCDRPCMGNSKIRRFRGAHEKAVQERSDLIPIEVQTGTVVTLLDTVNGPAVLEVDVAVERAAEEGVVRHHVPRIHRMGALQGCRLSLAATVQRVTGDLTGTEYIPSMKAKEKEYVGEQQRKESGLEDCFRQEGLGIVTCASSKLHARSCGVEAAKITG